MPADKKEMQLFAVEMPKVAIPPKSQNKKFEKADSDAMRELGDFLKVAVQIYKLNMTDTPATYSRLADYFSGTLERSIISSSLDILTRMGIITGEHGEAGEDTAECRYFIGSDHVWPIRAMYEELVRPKEKSEDQIDYVPRLLLENRQNFN